MGLFGQFQSHHSDLCWAGRMDFPLNFAQYGFELVGSMGSGKTTLMKLLLISVSRLINPAYDIRALVNDPKQEMYNLLEVLGVPFDLLNPLDTRSKRWAIGKDVGSAIADGGDISLAIELAQSMIPKPQQSGQNDIFYVLAQGLFAGVMEALSYRAGTNWTLRDVINTFDRPGIIEAVLNIPQTSRYIATYLKAREFNSVYLQLQATFQRWQPIVAAMECATEEVSIREWTTRQRVLLIGDDPERAGALEAINSGIVTVAANCLLAQGHLNSEERKSFLFLDELTSSIFSFETIARLQTKGREYGVVTVTGFQDFDDLAAKAGEKVAHTIISQPAWKVFLKQQSRRTAEICAELLRGGPNVPGVQGVQIMELPMFTHGEAIKGFANDLFGPCEFQVSQGFLEKHLVPFAKATKSLKESVEKRPSSQMKLEPWNEQDLRRLKLISGV